MQLTELSYRLDESVRILDDIDRLLFNLKTEAQEEKDIHDLTLAGLLEIKREELASLLLEIVGEELSELQEALSGVESKTQINPTLAGDGTVEPGMEEAKDSSFSNMYMATM